MAKRAAADVSMFVVDGLDVLGTITNFEDKREAKTEETHTLGDAWAEHSFVGLRSGEITQEGFYDDAVGSVHDMLSSGPGQSRILTYCLEGTATGAGFVGWSGGMQVNYQRQVSRGTLTKAKATYRSNGVIEGGKTLFPWGAVVATGKKNTLDNLVSSTGGAGYLQYNATAGEANIRILHSSNDIAFADLFVFTKTASGHGSERLTTTGSIKRYTAADFTTATATGTIAALNAFVGLVRTSTAP